MCGARCSALVSAYSGAAPGNYGAVQWGSLTGVRLQGVHLLIEFSVRILTNVNSTWSAREWQAINSVHVEYFYPYRPETRWEEGTIFILPKKIILRPTHDSFVSVTGFEFNFTIITCIFAALIQFNTFSGDFF